MNEQFENKFELNLEEIAFEFQNLDLEYILKNSDEYINLQKLISKIEKKGVVAKQQRTELEHFVGKFKTQFGHDNLKDLGNQQIEKLKLQIDQFDYATLISSLLNSFNLVDQHCKAQKPPRQSVNKILFEDWSGYGNILMYGFSGNLKSQFDFGEMIIDGIEEFDLSILYKGIKDIENGELKYPVAIISESISSYTDNVARLILSKALHKLYSRNSEEINNDSIFKKQVAFYHNHHDGIQIQFYQNK